MNAYLLLLRGVNVGGKSKVSMAELRACLEKLGFADVSTYIASGNVLLKSDKSAAEISTLVENTLTKEFKMEGGRHQVLVLNREQLKAVVGRKPKGFGEQPQAYHSDVIFLIGIPAKDAMQVFDPREGVDTVWQGGTVIYSQRLSALRTKSRLSKIIGTPAYKSMTIRTWNTTTKLLGLLTALDTAE